MSRPVHVMTDFTADLHPDLQKRYDISILPMYVTLGEESHRSDTVTSQQLFDYVDKTTKLPRTAAFSMVDMVEHAQAFIQEGYDVLYIGISERFSCCLQNAALAAAEIGGHLAGYDSRHLSSGVAHQVVRAAEMAKQGQSMETILQALPAITEHTHTSFFIADTRYLYYGGRCSALTMIGASVLKIRPIILVRDGGMTPGERLRGSAERCAEQYLQKMIPDWQAVRGPYIYLTYTADVEEELATMRGIVQQNRPDLQIVENTAGAIIACHCGPGTIGVIFETKA